MVKFMPMIMNAIRLCLYFLTQLHPKISKPYLGSCSS